MTLMCAADVTSQGFCNREDIAYINKARSKSTIGSKRGSERTSQVLFLLVAQPSIRVPNNVQHRTNKLHTGSAAAEVHPMDIRMLIRN
jgi:hypothetical protein